MFGFAVVGKILNPSSVSCFQSVQVTKREGKRGSDNGETRGKEGKEKEIMSGREATRQKRKKKEGRIASEKGNERRINFNLCILRGRAFSLCLLPSRTECVKYTTMHKQTSEIGEGLQQCAQHYINKQKQNKQTKNRQRRGGCLPA